MGNHTMRDTVKDWSRVALKLGLLLTEPKVRAAIGDQMKDRVDGFSDTISSKYDDAVERLESARDAIRGKRNLWPSRVAGFALGLGVGAGLGILLAPASGSETRDVLSGKAHDLKTRVTESAAAATGNIRRSVSRVPSAVAEG